MYRRVWGGEGEGGKGGLLVSRNLENDAQNKCLGSAEDEGTLRNG